MKRIRYGIPVLAAVMLCLLSGCGGRDEPRLGVDGYVYTADEAVRKRFYREYGIA